MTTDEFIAKYNGKGIDYDGYYGYQCMDLYQQYTKEVVGAPRVAAPAAANVWLSYPQDHYQRIANSPTNFPQKGDVVIWKKAANLPFGHIAVCISANASSFVSFDQNWPTGSLSHQQPHNYTNVQGWLRPKSVVGTPTPPAPQPPAPAPLITNQTLIDWGPLFGVMEVQATRGLLNDQRRDITTLKETLKSRDATLKEMLAHMAEHTEPSLSAIPTPELLAELGRRLLGR